MTFGPRGTTSRGLCAAAVLVAMFLVACGTSPATPSATSAPNGPATPGSPAPASPSGTATTDVTPTPAAHPPFDPTGLALSLEPVTDLPGRPLAVTTAPDGSGRMFVAEQGGRVWLVRDGQPAERPFLDISDRTVGSGERGLLGMAFHPDFPDDPRVFVNYTDLAGDTVVASFTVDPDDPDRVDPDSERPVLGIDQPFSNYNGGAVVFGPDGYLYVSTGDGGSGGDPHGNGQRLDTLLGKILRIDVDTAGRGESYAVPADNPFVGRSNARPEIWLYGLRNPWRIGFDRATGDLWIGDVGQSAFEEIDVARAGTAGANFGWALMEGFQCFPSGDGCARNALTLPVAEYAHPAGCSVIGGTVYRGERWPALLGGYVLSDVCSGTLWVLDAASDGPQEPIVVGESGRSISSFGEDAAGELYATDLDGVLLRVVVQ